jgi:hypothetical protein
MSTGYDFNFSTDLEPKQVLELLANKFSFKWGDETCLNGMGVIVGALKRDEHSQLNLESIFKVRSNSYVWFELSRSSDQNESYRNMLRVVMFLLQNTSGDVVLLFNGETPVLRRLNEQIIYNSNWSLLVPEEITVHYELQPL